ncbi:MAG: AMP-binding protein [Hyphomicrobiaceae bacterium]
MIAIDDRATIGAAFRRTVDAYGPNSFLAVPAGSTRGYHRQGLEIDYARTGREVECLMGAYRARGVGHGHRVAMLLENRPEHFLHKLALNTLGASCVPINPDLWHFAGVQACPLYR